MKQKEMSYSVYFEEYELAPSSSPDALEFLKEYMCPLCKGDLTRKTGLPDVEGTELYICKDCGLTTTVEAWWVK